jgi:hypothetical protein
MGVVRPKDDAMRMRDGAPNPKQTDSNLNLPPNKCVRVVGGAEVTRG